LHYLPCYRVEKTHGATSAAVGIPSATLPIQVVAVVAKAITTGAALPLVARNVAPRRTSAIVVMNAVGGRLLRLID